MAQTTILIVEDELIIARDIQAQLIDMGYAIAGHATTGDDAIALTAAMRPDLVLMDIQLKGAMDGIAAAQAIRDQFFIPVVFLSAFDAEAIIARAKLTEPYGYIRKPFLERELHTAIEMALYKHQTDAKLHASAKQLRALSQRVLAAQELERRRIALELHDEVGQSLAAIKISLQSYERLKNQSVASLIAENLVILDAAWQHVRQLAVALRPSMLDDLGLLPALRWMASQSATRYDFAVEFETRATDSAERLAPDIEVACFRIAQEALTNVARHARAKHVNISLSHDNDTLTMTVQDDGCGFDANAMRDRALGGASLGVLGMQERAMLIGGELHIESRPGQGCTLSLQCPWRLSEVKLTG